MPKKALAPKQAPAPSKVDPTQDGAGAEPTITLEHFQRLSKLAQEVIEIEEHMATLSETLKEKMERLRVVTTESLPALMEETGMKDFRLTSGERVFIKPIISASLPAEGTINKEKDLDKKATMLDRFTRGLAYLEKAGAGAIIKQEVSASLGKDSAKLAKAAIAALKALKIEAELSRGVHPVTLTSWVKERLALGKPVDLDLFAVYTGNKAFIEGASGSGAKKSSLPAAEMLKKGKQTGDKSLF